MHKKKGVNPSIAMLQSQLSRATRELGEQLGATSQFAGHAQSTTQAALHHAQAAKEESVQVRTMIDKTLHVHFVQTFTGHSIQIGRSHSQFGLTTRPHN